MTLLDVIEATCELVIEVGWAALVLTILVTFVLALHRLGVLLWRASWRVR